MLLSIPQASASRAVKAQASRPLWMPGADVPAHLDGSMVGDFGFDPLNLGVDKNAMKWYREAELQNGRWAMAAVAGILAQEIAVPDVNFFEAPLSLDLPCDVRTLLGVQILLMNWVEVRRWMDLRNPGSVNKDPIFGASLPDHEPGYPGGIFAPVVPGNLDDLKLKEIKNARLAMVALVGFFAQYHVWGVGPLACLGKHLADPNVNVYTNGVSLPFLN
jgi:light-harvesting complex I chlorophyll a/b binding protein 4